MRIVSAVVGLLFVVVGGAMALLGVLEARSIDNVSMWNTSLGTEQCAPPDGVRTYQECRWVGYYPEQAVDYALMQQTNNATARTEATTMTVAGGAAALVGALLIAPALVPSGRRQSTPPPPGAAPGWQR